MGATPSLNPVDVVSFDVKSAFYQLSWARLIMASPWDELIWQKKLPIRVKMQQIDLFFVYSLSISESRMVAYV